MNPVLTRAPHIIGLTGPAGSGKDTVADLLVVHAAFIKLDFSGPLTTEIVHAFLIDPVFLTLRETQHHPMTSLALSRCLDKSFVAYVCKQTLQLDLDAPRSPHQIMQWGTNYWRQHCPDRLITQTQKRIDFYLCHRLATRIVITDCRFADEAALVRTLGGQVWQIKRDGIDVAPGAHESEVTGDGFRPEVVLNNSHTVRHLQARVMEAYWTSCGGFAPGTVKVRIGAAA